MLMRIRDLRIAINMSQCELAADCGVSQSVVSQWETGTTLPRTRQLPDLARVLGCSIDELFALEPASPAMEAV